MAARNRGQVRADVVVVGSECLTHLTFDKVLKSDTFYDVTEMQPRPRVHEWRCFLGDDAGVDGHIVAAATMGMMGLVAGVRQGEHPSSAARSLWSP